MATEGVSAEEWRPLFELGVDSYYRRHFERGRWACETLLSRSDVPDPYRVRTRSNAVFYSLSLTESVPGTRIQPILFEVPAGWSRFNPSIALDSGGFAAIVRSSNYAVETSTGRYEIFDDEGAVITRNYLAHLTPDLQLKSATPIWETDVGLSRGRVRGYEDCRLFRWNGVWHVLAVTREMDPQGTCGIVRMRLSDGGFQDLVTLSSSVRHEKNWMPVIYDGELIVIYSCFPTVILHVTGAGVKEIIRHPGPMIARDFRGGSQGVPVEDGYLFVVHEVVVGDTGGRVYLHRFVRTDMDLCITDVSLPFYFIHPTVEYCCGLALRDSELVLSFGFQDREAFVATVPSAGVLETLHPV